ncbi:HofP DNA utilization family protein [Enterobacter sp. ENT03]|uniref:HofP DNA utilization family protein n=1 Tax=Enterobacter sp. ENT03 TaxID=2854780 RepID=UPI00210BA122|nr:HofP DNA utilization family protein [Enterobacter sp. ENT03]
MIVKRWMLAVMTFTCLTGMRDPFLPQPDVCQTAQLTQWRYQGFVAVKGSVRGILRDGSGKWHRATTGDLLSPGWRVGNITDQEMQIFTAAGCEPPQWRWTRQGDQHETMGRDNHDVQRTGSKSGSAEAGHADGGRRTGGAGAAKPGGAGEA